MTKRILCTGNGDELLEQVNGRVYRHVYDERSGRYLPIGEEASSSYGVEVRKHGFRVNDPDHFAQLTAMLDQHYENMAAQDLDATQQAAAGRYGY